MKVYVDGELPKECFDCPCFRNDIEICCGLDDGIKDYHNFVEDRNCPLATTQSLKQQVREEVVEQVNDYMKKHSHTIPVISKNRRVVYNIGLTRFLEQIKGETK